ncbi:hypothetical protein [Minwuia sp.]|uniref:hypothetical protein n=1 Tax=Minwuia sp. TaxID=2493630 RepID=UPI003A8D4FA1
MPDIVTPTAASILEQYENLILHDANEADTRVKLITDILYHTLGWTHADVHNEERVSEDGKTTWADYTIRTGMTALVVEAKRVGAAFHEVPDARRTRLQGKIMSGATGEAIIQARDYARKLSLPFAIVTNGNSWIIFPANRIDQVRFSDSSAVIFPDLKSVLDTDFAEFVDLLSRDAVINGSLENELLGRIENQIEDRRLNRFFPTGFSKITRHSLYPLIEDAIVTAFTEDIVNSDADLLSKMYVQTPDRRRFDNRVRIHISKREAVSRKAPVRAMRAQEAKRVATIITEAGNRARPIAMLVLGQVGAGKTTFLNHTRQVSAASIFEPKPDRPYPHWFQVDFRPFSPQESPLEFIIARLLEGINADPFLSDFERCVRHAYKDEIDALFRGPLFLLRDDEGERKRRISQLLMDDFSKGLPYVEKLLAYAARTRGVFLVIDNIDQFENSNTQSNIFSDSMALAQKVGASLICSMREATYIQHKHSPVFDAFDFDPISIEPPVVEAVLARRFFVARQLLEGKNGEFTAENGAEVKVENLSVIIDLVQNSVLGSAVGNLIDVLATSDIRLALRMTREFLQSGWTASGKALRIYESTGKYVMPQHEALRAIMIGTEKQYHEEFSVVGNPFDSRLAKTEAQMLRLFLLSAIVNMSSDSSFRYLEGTEIQENFRQLGFGDELTARVLEDLCRFRFIHTTSHTPPTFESSYIVSRLGAYIVRYLTSDMMFLENVMMDTFVADTDTWKTLRAQTEEVYSTRNIVERLVLRRKRVEDFFDYITSLYTPLREEAIRRGLSSAWCTHPLESARNQLISNLTRATRSAERNYGPTPDTNHS